MLKEYVMKSKSFYAQIDFRNVDPESDYEFFTQVRHDSSFYLDDARNFYDFEVKDFLEKNHSDYRIVCIRGEPAGYLRQKKIDHVRDKVQSVGLDLALKFRGKGYAKPIYHILLEDFKQNGLPIVLWVLDFNFRAISLYSQLGFKEVERCIFIQNGSKKSCEKIMLRYDYEETAVPLDL
jgi:GNAT superfamily N-acetyltransferase